MSPTAWAILLVAVVVGVLYLVGRRSRAPATFVHDGRTYTRQPDGSFIDAGGVLVTGAMVAILAAAYQKHLAASRSSDTSDGSWDSGSDSGGSDSGGDGGGGGGGGGGGD